VTIDRRLMWGGGGAIIAIALVWSFTKPRTYDECMLSEMRGQAQSMFENAYEICAHRFHHEFHVSDMDDFTFTVHSGIARAEVTKHNDEYLHTEATFQFSLVACAAIKDAADWSAKVTVTSREGDVFVFALPIANPVCGRGFATRARYR
jgi:hypothetical protein